MNSCTPCFRQSLAVALLVVACSIEGSRAAESLDGQFNIGKANSALVALVKAGWRPDKQPMLNYADMEQQFGSRGDRVRFGMNFGVWRKHGVHEFISPICISRHVCRCHAVPVRLIC